MSKLNKFPSKIHTIEAYKSYFAKTKPKNRSKGIDFEWDLTIRDADNPEIREIFGRNVDILDDFKLLYKKRVKLKHYHLREYILEGVQVTNEDFYWILSEPGKKKITYATCCSGIEKV